ncbi:MAG: RiPP maturation radical SAM C-methyltransferase, partial [Pirellulaceae bacterium]
MSSDVVFPVMPFADAGRPSMGVSLIAAHAKQAGYSTSVLYFNLALARRMGKTLYQQIANGYAPDILVGEWFFADMVYGDEIPDADTYIRDIFPRHVHGNELIDQLLELRRQREEYLDQCCREILAESPRIVGFTTTFHQTCACLAVAQRLKQNPNAPWIVFGGANCEGAMGLQLIRSFDCIDFVCSGEADVSFPALLGQLLGGDRTAPIPGVLRQGEAEEVTQAEPVKDMDALPFPDFDNYFATLADSPLANEIQGQLVFETSRGCWWGDKHHCTFCGLNGHTMAFRSKKPERALEEIEYLAARHSTKNLGCVDNILDMRYVDSLFPQLAERGLELDIFYEVKANLRYEQLTKMRDGGLTEIQPGIESFSNEVLKLMDKGCTAAHNVQLLRWCQELGINVAWNILAGFPGESPSEYEATARLVPQVTHLAPPCSCSLVRLDRFSPFHLQADKYGFKRVRPARAYFYVFPLGRRELEKLAYYFDFDYADERDPNEYLSPVIREVQLWIDSH